MLKPHNQSFTNILASFKDTATKSACGFSTVSVSPSQNEFPSELFEVKLRIMIMHPQDGFQMVLELQSSKINCPRVSLLLTFVLWIMQHWVTSGRPLGLRGRALNWPDLESNRLTTHKNTTCLNSSLTCSCR